MDPTPLEIGGDSAAHGTPAKSGGRLGKPKTRTGCVTCKIRRVKCDETKPSCNRCTSTGRQCDGYSQPAPRKPRIGQQPVRLRLKFTSPPTTLTSRHGLSPRDLRSIEYFHSHTASELGPWISDSFWKYYIPQLSSYSLATRHAIIALSAASEAMHMLRKTPEISLLEDQNNFSMRHYMLGVSALARSSGADEVVALATCVVFVMLNFVLGNFGMAILHMHNGVAVIQHLKERAGGMTELQRLLITLFNNMTIKGRWEEGNPMAYFEPELLELRRFVDLKEAGEAIKKVSKDGMRLIRVGVVLQYTGQKDGPRWIDLQHQIYIQETNIACWSWNFEALLSIMDEESPEASETIDELWISYASVRLWQHVSLTPDQSEPSGVFQIYIERVEQLYTKWVERGAADRYTLCRAGMIPPICYIAKNAVDPELRVRATNFLATAAPGVVGIQPGKASKQDDNIVAANEEGVIEIQVNPEIEGLDLVLKPGADGSTWRMV